MSTVTLVNFSFTNFSNYPFLEQCDNSHCSEMTSNIRAIEFFALNILQINIYTCIIKKDTFKKAHVFVYVNAYVSFRSTCISEQCIGVIITRK